MNKESENDYMDVETQVYIYLPQSAMRHLVFDRDSREGERSEKKEEQEA